LGVFLLFQLGLEHKAVAANSTSTIETSEVAKIENFLNHEIGKILKGPAAKQETSICQSAESAKQLGVCNATEKPSEKSYAAVAVERIVKRYKEFFENPIPDFPKSTQGLMSPAWGRLMLAN
jgi:hypothetical protein